MQTRRRHSVGKSKDETVTTTARSSLVLLFVFVSLLGAGFMFILPNEMIEISFLRMLVCYAIGLLSLIYSLLLFLEYRNMKLTVSEDGIIYTNRLNRTTAYDWNQVRVYIRFHRGPSVIFRLPGKTVWIGNYYKDFLKLKKWLENNGKTDV